MASTAALAAHHHIVTNAVKACGTVITVGPLEFSSILDRMDKPLVVYAEGGLFAKRYQYLVAYRGLAFHCKSPEPLEIPLDAEIVVANKMVIPDL